MGNEGLKQCFTRLCTKSKIVTRKHVMGGSALPSLPLQSPCKELKEVIDLHIMLVIMTTSRISYALTLVQMDYDFIVTIGTIALVTLI